MRVLHIFTNSHMNNGATTFEYRVSRKLKEKGIFFDYLVTEEPNEEEKRLYGEAGSNVYVLPIDKKHGIIIREIRMNRLYYKFFKEHKYDMIYVDTENGLRAIHMLMAKLAGVKVRVLHSHNTALQTNSKASKLIHKYMKNLFSISATHYLACSDGAAHWLFPKKIYENGDYEVINNGVDTDVFKFDNEKRTQMRQKYNIKENDVVAGCVGRFAYQKNHSYMLDVAAKAVEMNSNFKLLLLGNGELEDELRAKAEGLGIADNIIFAGTSTDVNDYLSAMDVFILTSRFEGLGIVLIEAQSNGLRAVVADTVPRETKMADETTYMSLDANPSEWAKKLFELAELRDDGRKAQKVMNEKEFTLEATANRLYEIYKSLV